MTERRDSGEMPPVSGPGSEESWSGDPPQVEGYEITGLLGQGGMGTVWGAVQLSTRREVALKLLGKGGFSSEKARARFEREVELTARLEHPSIAGLYDSGLYRGVHYYAMELIEGVPLDEYAADQHLTQRQILELMRTVCEAVQHAHQNGVIHRDLKPTNILVSADGQPHILDFGLAKGFLEKDSSLSVSSQDEAAGTPAYMSPEQAAGHLERIDTRTDVYALGVVLFRLLTGESPHDLSGTRYEVLRRVAEEEVRRPRQLTRDVDRELEALLLKALAYDPKDRYPSSGAFGQDIENYLSNEPLTAKKPTTAYFLYKRIRKYRVRVAVACSVLAVLIGTTIFSYLHIRRQRNRAVRAEGLARNRLGRLEEAHNNLQKEADKAKAANLFLRSMITSPHPIKPGTSNHPVLDRAARDVGITYADQPEVEAAVRTEIGNALVSLEQLDAAEAQFARAYEIRRRVLGDEHSDTLASIETLAAARVQTGKLDEAESLQKQLLEIRRRVLGEDDPETFTSMNDLRLTFLKSGNLDELEALQREILEIRRRVAGEEHSDTLSAMSALASVLRRRGKLDEAEAMLKQSVEIRRRVLGENRWDTLPSMNRLAAVFEESGKLDEAEALRRELLEIQLVRGERHSDALRAMNNLAATLWRGGKLDEAEAINRRILEMRRRVHGDEHLNTLWAMSNLSALLEEMGKLSEAEALRKQADETRLRVFGGEHTDTPPGPSPSEGEVLAWDDFDGELSLDWKVLNPDPSHFSLTKNPGTLTIATQEGAFNASHVDYENLLLIDSPLPAGEDFQLTMCLSSFRPVYHWNQAGLICYNDDDNYLKFVYQWTTMPAGPVFTVGMETEGSFSFLHFLPRHEGESVWLRITKCGCRYTLSTSTDGVTFLPAKYPEHDRRGLFQGAVVWGDGRVRQVGLFAKNGPGTRAPEIDASFDFFEVRPVPRKTGRAERRSSASAAAPAGNDGNNESGMRDR